MDVPWLAKRHFGCFFRSPTKVHRFMVNLRPTFNFGVPNSLRPIPKSNISASPRREMGPLVRGRILWFPRYRYVGSPNVLSSQTTNLRLCLLFLYCQKPPRIKKNDNNGANPFFVHMVRIIFLISYKDVHLPPPSPPPPAPISPCPCPTLHPCHLAS